MLCKWQNDRQVHVTTVEIHPFLQRAKEPGPYIFHFLSCCDFNLPCKYKGILLVHRNDPGLFSSVAGYEKDNKWMQGYSFLPGWHSCLLQVSERVNWSIPPSLSLSHTIKESNTSIVPSSFFVFLEEALFPFFKKGIGHQQPLFFTNERLAWHGLMS